MKRGEKSDMNIEGDSDKGNGCGRRDGLDRGRMFGENKDGFEDRMDSGRDICDGILSIL